MLRIRRAVRASAALLALAFALVIGVTQSAAAQSRNAADDASDEVYEVVFLGPQGPVFLSLQITSGPRGVTAVRRDYTAIVMRTLDDDGDGRLNASEAARIPRDGQLFGTSQTLGEEWNTVDATPQDGAVTIDELFAFIDANLGERFRVELRTRQQESARLFSPLDTDRDGLISRDEIESGFASLRAFDFDDDETLSVAELQPFPTSMLQAGLRQQGEDATQLPVIVLTTDDQRRSAAGRLLKLYADPRQTAGQPEVDLDRIGAHQESLARFDGDGNGRLNDDELSELLRAPPGLPVAVNISRNRVTVPDWDGFGPLVAERPRSDRRRVNCLMAGMAVELRAINDVKGRMSDREAMMSLYLQRFIQFDQDSNKYLDAAEFASLGLQNVQFASADADADGMLTRQELKALLEVTGRLSQALIVLTVSDERTTLFDLLDEDEDNRLDPREFLEGYGRVRRYDLDRDRRLAAAELESSFQFTVALAKPEILREPFAQPAMAAAARQPRIQAQTSGPTWFRKMDRNLDGDLTWREFLGTREDFERIDTDRNSLIDLDEAVAAE